MHESLEWHLRACPAFARYCEKRGLEASSLPDCLEEFPYLPVHAFKYNADLLLSVDRADIKTRLQSSATSGTPSEVGLDKLTQKRQVKALTAVIAATLGAKRRPVIMMDVDPREYPQNIGARGAAVRGFLNLASEVYYVMRPGPEGCLVPDEARLERALKAMSERAEPCMVFGFTFVLYAYGLKPLLDAGKSCGLPEGSHVVHIGGWKKLAEQQVSRDVFAEHTRQVFGVPQERVLDFYGFTEQMGINYPDNGYGEKRVPAYAAVLVRDPVTHAILPSGEVGLLQFLTPLPHSYPGISVLTDDLGRITCDQAGNQRFEILGRAKKAEVRGCGDILGDKVFRASRIGTDTTESDCRILWDVGKNGIQSGQSMDQVWSDLPRVDDISGFEEALRKGQATLAALTVDERIALVFAASKRWVEGSGALAQFRNSGLQFLAEWCDAVVMRGAADRSLRGARGYMDAFRPEENSSRRLVRAFPRGICVHWLAGNVPLLGMLALAQSIVAGNANLLKASRSYAWVLPALLDAFRNLEVSTASGHVIRGEVVLDSTAVVYCDVTDRKSHEELSGMADLRVAWGGREAIESVLSLPRKIHCEDVIFGPKLSYMVIGKEALHDGYAARKLARKASVDFSVFDQYACASPHTLFVEEGGEVSVDAFVAMFGEALEKTAKRLPMGGRDPEQSARIEGLKIRYEMLGDVLDSPQGSWTVLVDRDGAYQLAHPIYGRVITIRVVEDVMLAAKLAHRGIQTVGLALEPQRKQEFALEAACRGAERFPDIGRMTHFDTPWDGLYTLDRMVRWVSMGGPF